MFRVTTLRLAASIVLLASVALAAGEDREIEFREDIEYGKVGDTPLLLNLAAPKDLDAPAPAIVCIHGGGWAAGNKRDFNDLAKKFAQHGYVAATVGYRLAPQHPFPAQVEDVKCAVRWLRDHAEELHIDPERIGAVGASAGAHLAMMLGVMDRSDGLEGEGGSPDESSKVQAVVAYFGPTNLVGEYPPASRGIVKNFIGGTLEERKDDYQRASPITYVDKTDAPTLIFQGTKDILVPYDQAIQMAAALNKANVPGRIEILVGANHGWGGKEFERTMRATREFFDQYLAEKQSAKSTAAKNGAAKEKEVEAAAK